MRGAKSAVEPIRPSFGWAPRAAVAYDVSLGVTVRRVMTDIGSCYKARAFRAACRDLRLKHVRTKPYTPKTNERPSALSRPPCANGPMPRPIRRRDIGPTRCPNGSTTTIGHRPHGGIKYAARITRLGIHTDNLLRLHI